eukprot:3999477-Amphidinium_carterae.1
MDPQDLFSGDSSKVTSVLKGPHALSKTLSCSLLVTAAWIALSERTLEWRAYGMPTDIFGWRAGLSIWPARHSLVMECSQHSAQARLLFSSLGVLRCLEDKGLRLNPSCFILRAAGSARTVSRTKTGDVQLQFPGCSIADEGSSHVCTSNESLMMMGAVSTVDNRQAAHMHGLVALCSRSEEEEVHVQAIYDAAWLRRHGTARREYFEKEGRRLMSSTRWGEFRS